MGKIAAKKSKPADRTKPPAPDALKALGAMTTSGTCNGAAVIQAFQSNLIGGKEIDFRPIYDGLTDRVENIQAGDLRLLESMLFSQASALQTIFSSLARRASSQELLPHYQTFLRLALKAQAQSRSTIEALVELKQPRGQPTFIKQANVAAGHQQVNNSYAAASAHTTNSRTGNSSTVPNELLVEVTHGIDLDIGAQSQTGGADPQLEAVGAVNRAAYP